MSTRRERFRSEAGLTLVELSVAVSLLAVVLGLAYGTLWSSMRHGSSLEQRTVAQSESRLVLDGLTRELRQAYSGDAATAEIASMSGTELTFYSPDRDSPFHLRRISYRLNGTTLERSETVSSDTDGAPWSFGTTGPYRAALKDVASTSLFSYLDEDGAVTAIAGDVRTVVVAIQVGKSFRSPGPLSYRLSIHLRGAQ